LSKDIVTLALSFKEKKNWTKTSADKWQWTIEFRRSVYTPLDINTWTNWFNCTFDKKNSRQNWHWRNSSKERRFRGVRETIITPSF
jgi:hypothetical protein